MTHTRPTHRRPGGFTLVEVLIAMVIFSLIMTIITMVLRTGTNAWRTGHGMNEMLLNVRVTKDIMFNDLDNLIYIHESNYNRTFRENVREIAMRRVQENTGLGNFDRTDRISQDRLEEIRDEENDEDFEGLHIANVAPPIDLSFQGSDGDLDRLVFARSYRPTLPDDPLGWGIRRVEFYVEDGTLFRKEKDAFNFHPNSFMGDEMNQSPELANLLLSFMESETDKDRLNSLQIYNPETDRINIPYEISYAEPLCSNVELFDIKYGYFKDKEWIEANDWDSDGRKYRFPPEDDYYEDYDDNGLIDRGRTRDTRRDRNRRESRLDRASIGETSMMGLIPEQQLRQPQVPDELPGYLAIQIGVRMEKGRGRLHSFTFYHPMPSAQEIDIKLQEEEDYF